MENGGRAQRVARTEETKKYFLLGKRENTI